MDITGRTLATVIDKTITVLVNAVIADFQLTTGRHQHSARAKTCSVVETSRQTSTANAGQTGIAKDCFIRYARTNFVGHTVTVIVKTIALFGHRSNQCIARAPVTGIEAGHFATGAFTEQVGITPMHVSRGAFTPVVDDTVAVLVDSVVADLGEVLRTERQNTGTKAAAVIQTVLDSHAANTGQAGIAGEPVEWSAGAAIVHSAITVIVLAVTTHLRLSNELGITRTPLVTRVKAGHLAIRTLTALAGVTPMSIARSAVAAVVDQTVTVLIESVIACFLGITRRQDYFARTIARTIIQAVLHTHRADAEHTRITHQTLAGIARADFVSQPIAIIIQPIAGFVHRRVRDIARSPVTGIQTSHLASGAFAFESGIAPRGSTGLTVATVIHNTIAILVNTISAGVGFITRRNQNLTWSITGTVVETGGQTSGTNARQAGAAGNGSTGITRTDFVSCAVAVVVESVA